MTGTLQSTTRIAALRCLSYNGTNALNRGCAVTIHQLRIELGISVYLSPVLKWAGGKTQLLQQFQALFPREGFDSYHEPFVGGGAVFFHLYSEQKITQAVLSDSNPELINCYQVIRDSVDELIDVLKQHKLNHSKDYFYKIRSLDRDADVALNPVERAARMIYLNRTCYNGLWRVNSKGQVNVPIGSYKNPKILDEDKLLAVSTSLSNAGIYQEDFRQVVGRAVSGDFIYFDPPYVPLNTTSSFTSYTADDFGIEDQKDLADVFLQLHRKGCRVMLSNSDTPLVRELYAGFRIESVKATRAINSKPNGRGEIDELVILNY